MQPQTLNCPMCGAPARDQATQCQHCGARLATVGCPVCFAMMFLGSKHCPHCGAEADRTELDDEANPPCPRCKIPMRSIVVGGSALRECPRCDGLWVNAAAFEKICADQEKQAAVLGASKSTAALPEHPGSIRYVPCPDCAKLMHRVNFANCSGVVVDVCKGHGTWFDRDELMRIVQFIRSGGLQASRDRRKAELLEEERRVRRMRESSGAGAHHHTSDERASGIRAARDLLRFFLR